MSARDDFEKAATRALQAETRVAELGTKLASFLKEQKRWEAIDAQRVGEICLLSERVNQQTQLIRRMREVLRRLFVISPANHELGPFAKPYGEALTAAADMLEESREHPTAQVKMGADGSIDPRATFASTRYPEDTTAQATYPDCPHELPSACDDCTERDIMAAYNKGRKEATQDHGACPHCGHKWTRGNENNTCADCDRSIMSAAEKASNGEKV